MVICQQLSVAEIWMLQSFCGHRRRDRVRNQVFQDRIGVVPIEKKLTQHRLRWVGHVQWRLPKAPVRNGVLKRVDNVRVRSKLNWDKLAKRDPIKDWNISKEVALNRS